MRKIRYEVDPHNRLAKIGPDKFRTVLDGNFKLAGANTLVYHVKKSDNIDVPQEVKFSGNWSLGQGNKIIFTLDKWNNQAEGDKLVLKGEIINAYSDELVFSVTTRGAGGNRKIYVLNFAGAWQADKHNRLSFKLAEEKGAAGKLTLQGKWEVNRRNEIVYTVLRTGLKAREKTKNSIALKGFWEITVKDRVSYVLNNELGSRLDFKVGLERAERDSLVYGISAGCGAKKRSIALFGRWRFDRGAGLYFEINHSGRRLRLDVKMTKSFLNGCGEGFIRALASQKEAAIIGGFGFKW